MTESMSRLDAAIVNAMNYLSAEDIEKCMKTLKAGKDRIYKNKHLTRSFRIIQEQCDQTISCTKVLQGEYDGIKFDFRADHYGPLTMFGIWTLNLKNIWCTAGELSYIFCKSMAECFVCQKSLLYAEKAWWMADYQHNIGYLNHIGNFTQYFDTKLKETYIRPVVLTENLDRFGIYPGKIFKINGQEFFSITSEAVMLKEPAGNPVFKPDKMEMAYREWFTSLGGGYSEQGQK